MAESKVEKKIEKAVIDLLCDHPFFGTLLLEATIEKSDNLPYPTMMVDPRGNIYFSEEFVNKLTQPQLQAVLCHEVLHLALLHFIRQETKNKKVWNVATDLEINGCLIENGFSLPQGALIPPANERKLSAEDWYKKLLENLSIQEKTMDIHIYDDEIEKQEQGNGNQNQDSQGNQNQDSQGNQGNQNQSNQDNQGGGQEQGQKQEQNNQGQDSQKKKNKKEKERESGKGKEKKEEGKMIEKRKEMKGKNTGDKENIVKKWTDALARAVNLAKMQGKIPAGLDDVIEKILRPQLDWRQVLRQFITKTIIGDVDWSRKDRRFKDVYLPQHREKIIEIVIAVDTSGSIGKNELERFFGEVNGILQSNGKYKIWLIQCDADIQKVEVISYPHKLPADGIEIKGRGGTDFRPVFEYMRRNHLQMPLIYFTDSYGTFPSFPPTFPILWVITDAKRKKDIPFGNVIILEKGGD
jgi:predicted metal-dependent peptidase